jgi:hypothetical protein
VSIPNNLLSKHTTQQAEEPFEFNDGTEDDGNEHKMTLEQHTETSVSQDAVVDDDDYYSDCNVFDTSDDEDNVDTDKDSDDDANTGKNNVIDGHNDDYDDQPCFGPRTNIPDDDIPFTKAISSSITRANCPASLKMQVELQHVFLKNKGSLKMYDDVVNVFNDYISSSDFTPYTKIMKRDVFLSQTVNVFNTSDWKPTYGAVRLHDNSLATVPIFNMKAMILSILHDPILMRSENFADGYDIFTGNVDQDCKANQCYGEIHTGDAWIPARNKFCGAEGKYMPLAIVLFGDKSHTDLHGALSVTPITFVPSFFNRKCRNNPKFWRPMAYIPNLAYGKSVGGKSTTKVQDEHNCLMYSLKSLVELSDSGGIRTNVMGKQVHVKVWIHFFIGDTEGHNKWLGHYSASNSGVKRPYRDCHCTFEEMSTSNPSCQYTTASELRRATRLINHDKKSGVAMFNKMSRHCLNNALFQPNLPLADTKYGANRMQPPEMLHVSDAGLIIYMMESLQGRIGSGESRLELDRKHVHMLAAIRRQSERDFPRGAARSGLIDTTRCQSSERKGNFFIMMCIAHTAAGELTLKHELNLSNAHWLKWKQFLKLYLGMEAWFHDSIDKEEVIRARPAIASVLDNLKLYFPRQEDSNGYNIPKMHGLAKMQDYVCLYGSAMNFYGGPGEASHKQFVKAPGLKTQRRMCEFATQTAGQYYNFMSIEKARNEIIGQSLLQHEEMKDDGDVDGLKCYNVQGKYSVTFSGNNLENVTVQFKNKKKKSFEINEGLERVLRRMCTKNKDGNNENGYSYVAYTRASVIGEDGETVHYNAHPQFHGEAWYDWSLVFFRIENDNGDVEEDEYYPSRILGYVTVNSEVQAVVQCATEPLDWTFVQEKFIVPCQLCTNFDVSFQIVPITALNDPLCVVPDYGGKNDNDYLIILPKRYWGQYFTQFINSFGSNFK